MQKAAKIRKQKAVSSWQQEIFICLLPSSFCFLFFYFICIPEAPSSFSFCLLPSAFCFLLSAFCLLPSVFCLLYPLGIVK
jgi:hypothetical protein